MDTSNCFHCGLGIVEKEEIVFDQKRFCCNGCKTVYEIFSFNGLDSYYNFEKAPGTTPTFVSGKYDFLDNDKISEKLLSFSEGTTHIVSFHIPFIHCSSCIWVLENLHRIQGAIIRSQVNFPRKTVRIHFDSSKITLKAIATLLASIGYEPYISLDDYETTDRKIDRSLVYKLGVAFFSFGNIMLLSFPEYFEVHEFWLDQYRGFFRWIIFALALPSFVYSASGYYLAAWKSIRNGMLNIEIPIALGIVVMFIRSTFDILFDHGPGFFDSLCGLVFFMLLGKMFQAKTYNFLSFERDYKSYFPIAVTKLLPSGGETSIPVHEVKKGDRLLIRNMELIPSDGILISPEASIDYSFVTGEALPVTKKSGDKIFAGGRQIGKAIEMDVLRSVSQSYLTQLWSNDVFQKDTKQQYQNITDTVSHYFTPVLLLIAFAGFGYWIFIDTDTAFNVFTAVLIVACPCALALTAPFTMGNVIRLMGRQQFYLKNAQVIEQLAKADTLVFDKTGTITTSKMSQIRYEGTPLDKTAQRWIASALRGSNHPLSRMLYATFPEETDKASIGHFEEISGKGIAATVEGNTLRIGSSGYAGPKGADDLQTCVHIEINGDYYGKYIFRNEYRPGITALFQSLKSSYGLKVLSGDNEGEREHLRELLPPGTRMVFNQKPEQKLQFIKKLQDEGKNVLMIGDGLNDAGALAQSNVGIALSENVNVFSPACDAILDASRLREIGQLLALSKKAMQIMKWSFMLSLAYNVVGLAFALSGKLLPLVAAIIMPLSTVTIVCFVTVLSNFYARKLSKYNTEV